MTRKYTRRFNDMITDNADAVMAGIFIQCLGGTDSFLALMIGVGFAGGLLICLGIALYTSLPTGPDDE